MLDLNGNLNELLARTLMRIREEERVIRARRMVAWWGAAFLLSLGLCVLAVAKAWSFADLSGFISLARLIMSDGRVVMADMSAYAAALIELAPAFEIALVLFLSGCSLVAGRLMVLYIKTIRMIKISA